MTTNTSHQTSAATSVSDLNKPSLPSDGEKDVPVDTKDESSPQPIEVEKDVDALNRELSRIDTADYPSAFPLTMIVIALAASIFLVALDMTIVATAIPKITDQFHSLDQVGWYGSAFFLTVGSFQATWGKVYKYFPLKTSYPVGILIFEVGSLICAVANNWDETDD